MKQKMSKITRFTIGHYRYYRKNQLLSLSLSVENGLSVIPAGNPTPATFLTPRVTNNGLGFYWVGDQTLQVSWLFVADLEIIS